VKPRLEEAPPCTTPFASDCFFVKHLPAAVQDLLPQVITVCLQVSALARRLEPTERSFKIKRFPSTSTWPSRATLLQQVQVYSLHFFTRLGTQRLLFSCSPHADCTQSTSQPLTNLGLTEVTLLPMQPNRHPVSITSSKRTLPASIEKLLPGT
jgi:hypothetical protein